TAILRYVRDHPGAQPKDIAKAVTSVDAPTIRRTCARMATDGQLAKDATGRYFADNDAKHEGMSRLSHVSHCPTTPPDQWKEEGQPYPGAVPLPDPDERNEQ
ncbi:MAG: DNA repair protein RadA, partial [Streptomyces sp.]|nr:DNA repair protein RadA [Streptomyces sp.]